MKRVIIAVLAAGLVGCSTGGGDGDSVNPRSTACLTTYAYETDQYGELGIHLNPTIDEVGSFYSYISFEEMEAEYLDVEKCAANNNTPGPNITFTSFDHFGFPLNFALYNYANQTAYIDTDVHEDWATRNCISDREYLRHEYMHHILFLNGEDDSHANPKFEQCDALGPKTCNGEYCVD